MKIIGCDFHPSYQQIALVDTETGELWEGRLEHQEGQARRFDGARVVDRRCGADSPAGGAPTKDRPARCAAYFESAARTGRTGRTRSLRSLVCRAATIRNDPSQLPLRLPRNSGQVRASMARRGDRSRLFLGPQRWAAEAASAPMAPPMANHLTLLRNRDQNPPPRTAFTAASRSIVSAETLVRSSLRSCCTVASRSWQARQSSR
jgi:hypothetical protein